MNDIHVTALFATSTAAHAARDGLVAAGIDANRILVLDRGHDDTPPPPRSPNRLWAALKQMFVHDDDAHHYADAIVRGNPLLVTDITEAERAAALNVLQSFAPIKVDAQLEGARRFALNEATLSTAQEWTAYRNPGAAGSEGIVGGSVLAGDYGSVGAVHGASANTDILRGKRFTEPHSADDRVSA